jgi:divalent metal cation (Fe/Co/Zn/Cd) transporter
MWAIREDETVAATASGVVGVGTVQVRWLGHRLAADIAIRVDGALSVAEGPNMPSRSERTCSRASPT